MPRRIEIELTSHADGAWTWRAAGARQPKGTVPEDLVPGPVSVGDVLRAEVETGLDGIEIVALAAPPAKADTASATRIEVLGAPRRGPDVSVTLASGSRRREGGARRGQGERRGPGERRRPTGDRGPGERRGSGERRGPGGERRPAAHDGGPQRERAAKDRDRKPPTSTVHRNAMLATLGPEQLPVAEQLLRGGIPAVRAAIADQRGGQAANGERLLAIAEQLLPAVNLASWKDRAAAAQAAGKELRLRELRAVVTASRTVTLDDEARAMAKALRELLDQRVAALREEWLRRIGTAADGGRVLDAVRATSRPPEPATRLPAELAVKVADAAGAAMTADLDVRSWLALLDAVVESPVRRTVRPAGIPDDAEAQEAARRAAGLVPELAKLLGLRIPPPPPRRVRVSAVGGGGPAGAP